MDGDDQLDIYVGCGRRTPPRNLYPNQLHWQRTPGQFVNVAAERGLDIPEVGVFVWLDADNDRDMDLLSTDNQAFWLYVNQSGRFTRQPIGQSGSIVRNLTIADYDSDGDIDVFAVTEKRNIFLMNHGGTYKLTDPQSLGLPARSYAAQWVDYDNDGLTDLYVSPDGIYRQRPNRRFEATQILERQYAKGRLFGTWFDADHDGLRDVLVAVKEMPPIWKRAWLKLLKIVDPKLIVRFEKWNLVLYRNMGTKTHWVQFQLMGSEGNRPAVGAVVEVTSPDGTQRQQVGQADGSIRSQGHYRLYFGLGPHQQQVSAKIFWPDGHIQDMNDLAVDQLFVVQRKGLKVSRSAGLPY
ncbi:CRTAC1 family protein [Candidatus Entotheonella palauensis]|uniref:CRTAC1 family protein n=1 Tax=Candidatus Entotheonella palauensis TaxID=93172 RepID=UPI001177C0FA|nr:CRTAC1 family protein [Candidatus Entotheonella palauensis]